MFFTGTVVYALIDGTSDYNALSHDLGPWMTIHGAIMVLAGLGFGFAVMQGRGPAALDRDHLDGRGRPGVPVAGLCLQAPQLFAAAIRDLGFAGMGAALLGLHLVSGKPALRTDDFRASTRPDGSALRWVLGAVASVLVVCGIAAPAAVAARPDHAALARMDRVIRDGMERSGMPGFAVAVVSGNDVAHARGFGDTGDGGRVTPQTPFLLGSTSKSFTALAAMLLVDAGKLELDAPARRYVREFQLADQRAADRITVRQVLQQTTGMPATAGGRILRSAADGTALEALQRAARHGPGHATWSGVRVRQRQLRPGGADRRASLRRALRPIRPAPHLHAAWHARQLRHARRRQARRAGDRAPLLVRPEHCSRSHLPPGGIQSAGYLISSAQDMALYLAMYLNDGVAADGERIVSQRGLDTMLAPGRPGTLGPVVRPRRRPLRDRLVRRRPWSEPAQLHPGRAPDSSALMVMFPRRDLAVVTLTNAANQLSLPGYPASVDRVERNAVDALIGDPVDTGTSLHRYYLYVDLIALVLLAAVTWPVVRAARVVRTRTRPRRRWLAIAGVVTRAGGGVLLVALPALHVRVAGLVPLATRCVHRHRPHRDPAAGHRRVAPRPACATRSQRGPQEGPASGTVPAESDPAPALVAR